MKKKIALGVDDFREIIEGNHYLVDKSLMIKEAIFDGAKVTLLPRPRRWGKTLNMMMLKYFFEKVDQSNRYLFNGLAIEQYPEIMEYQGKYPVIFLTLKDAKKLRWNECLEVLQDIIAQEYRNHAYLLQSNLFDEQEKNDFQSIINKTASETIYARSLQVLCKHLHRYHGVEPIVLIDEYDAPIIAGFENGYYKDVVNFMLTFLGSALKSNIHLKKAFLTGILRISKESIFSGLNNLKVCTLLDDQYSEYFGFSEDEVQEILDYYGPHECDEKVKYWYNNYQVGNSRSVYNPWSVISYIDKGHLLMSHWMNSSNNFLVKEIIQKNSVELKQDFELLIRGETIEKDIVDCVTFDSLFKQSDVAFNFLLLTGYLSFERKYVNEKDEWKILLKIPNKEVYQYYRRTISEWIEESLSMLAYRNMLKDLISGDLEEFKRVFERTVEQSLSFHDVAGKEPEKFYHMFVLGMLVALQDSHQVVSNRESAQGRYDVMVIPKDTTKMGIIIEFKVADKKESLEQATKEALAQIQKKNYKAELEARGIKQIINVGIAFSGKEVLVEYQV